MAKTTAYDLNCQIRIQRNSPTAESGGFKASHWIDLGNEKEDDPSIIRLAKWEGLKGLESIVADSVQSTVEATVTIPYRTDVTSACRVINVSSGVAYEIVTQPLDVGSRHRYLEFKVKASVNGQ